jgi:flagellar protein FliS
MNPMNARSALNQYRNMGLHSNVMEASPHRLIQMLMEGALERLATAKGSIERGDSAQKGSLITGAISIIGGLQASLDMDAGGEIAANLDALYEYMNGRLLKANASNDVALLDEVTRLLLEIKSGWDAIPEAIKNAPPGASVRVSSGA